MHRPRNELASHALWKVLGLTLPLVSSCAEPHYERAPDAASAAQNDATAGASLDGADGSVLGEDSGAAGPAGADAAVEADAPDAALLGAPPWAAAALGQYAIRSRFFSRGFGTSAFNQLMNEWLWLSTVSYDPASGQVRMSSRICASAGTNSFGSVVVAVELSYPTSLRPHEYQILSDGTEWYSKGDPALYGFSPTPLVPCSVPGALVSCTDEQKRWLSSGLCECPTDSSPPIQVEDCRIDDDDLDREPGFTVRATGGVSQTYYVRAVDRSDYVHGTFDEGGALQRAFYRPDIDTLQIGCNPEPCASSDSVDCDPGLNPVVLRRLPGPTGSATFDCTDVVAMKGALFSTDALTFPEGC